MDDDLRISFAVILSAAKDPKSCSEHDTEILRCAQDDSRGVFRRLT
jgi:hypothetical protein